MVRALDGRIDQVSARMDELRLYSSRSHLISLGCTSSNSFLLVPADDFKERVAAIEALTTLSSSAPDQDVYGTIFSSIEPCIMALEKINHPLYAGQFQC